MVKVTMGMTLDGWAPDTYILISMIHDFYHFFNKETGIRNK